MTNSDLVQAARIRVDSVDVVETMARRNHAPFTRNACAAAVTLGDVTYFWAA